MRILWRTLQLSVCSALLCAALASSARADIWDKKTYVTFNESVEIPGQVLPGGNYVFKLLPSISERHIVQIWSGDESYVLATIITVPIYRDEAPGKSVFEFDERPGNSPQALHAWFYPGEAMGYEFLYPSHRLTQ